MKFGSLLIASMLFSAGLMATDAANAAGAEKEKPTQHLKVADVKSMAEAKEVFIDTTAQIKRKKTIGSAEASQIHIITYSLEKSVAYFAANLSGDKQALAKEIAVVVEEIHLASENTRLGELQNHLGKYADLVDKFLFDF